MALVAVWGRAGIDVPRLPPSHVGYLDMYKQGYAPEVRDPLVHPPGQVYPPVAEHKTSEPPPQDPKATIRPTLLRDPKPIRAGLKLSIFSVGPPNSCCQTTDEDYLRAAQVRLLRAVPEPVEGAWDALTAKVFGEGSLLSKLRVRKFRVTPKVQNAWIQTQPPAAQGRYRVAQKSLLEYPLDSRDTVASGFLKIEKAVLLGMTGKALADPRIISAYKDRRQLVTGPVHKHMARCWRKILEPKPGNPGVWVNGKAATADGFGAWYDGAVASFMGRRFLVIWGDQNKFEAHRPPEAQESFVKLNLACNDDVDFATAMEATDELRVRGMHHRWDFDVEYKLGSGVTETSLDSAYRNTSSMVHVFGEPEWGRVMYAVNGDDFVCLCLLELAPDECEFQRRMLQLGFECDYASSENPWDAEFCQMLPYPTAGGTVWGPKIGRVLTRLPWQTTAARDDPRGVAIGMLTSCHHVPFLKQYLERVIALAEPLKIKAVLYEHRAVASRRFDASPETWAFLQHHYQLDVSALVCFEAHISRLEFGMSLTWDPIHRLVAIDA